MARNSVSVKAIQRDYESEDDTVALDPADLALPTFITNFSASSSLNPASKADVLDTLLEGLARLMDGQRRFADRMGLRYERVFSYDFSPFVDKDIHAVLERWAKVDPARLNAFLPLIFEDISVHQMALISALDGVVRRTLKYVSPEYTHGGTKVINRLLNPVWKQYCRRHGRISADARLRHDLLIAPGLARKYMRIRDRYFARRSKANRTSK